MENVCSIIHFSFLYMYMACLIINYCVSAVPRASCYSNSKTNWVGGKCYS